MEDPVYEKVNTAWKQTCKVVLGDEIGELKEYEEWLSEYLTYPLGSKPSALSGKPVCYSVPDYPDSAKLISLEEVDFNKKFEPLNINEIKDIDSIVEAVQERIVYTGNIILENSKFISKSSNISNSFYVYNSNFLDGSKNMGMCTYVRGGENDFGVNNAGTVKFIIRAVNTGSTTRCFEMNMAANSTDLYYVHNADNCMNAMFSFNIRGKRHMIGNLQLPQDKYYAIHKKLLAELREELKEKKRLPSLFDLVQSKKMPKLPRIENVEEKTDKQPIEIAFQKVTKTVLGKSLIDMDSYEDWLMQYVRKVASAPSAVSGKPVYYSAFYPYSLVSKQRLVTQDEGIKLGETFTLDESEIGSVDKIMDSLWKTYFFALTGTFEKNTNMIESVISRGSSNCYKGGVYIYNEYCGLTYWARESKYIFGSENALASQTCLHCYHSVDLARCFEVDSCSLSSDLYFSHNCENVNDSMFCFNKKNLKYAIGNASIGPEKYKPLRVSILEQITDELEEKKSFRWNIYNIAEKG